MFGAGKNERSKKVQKKEDKKTNEPWSTATFCRKIMSHQAVKALSPSAQHLKRCLRDGRGEGSSGLLSGVAGPAWFPSRSPLDGLPGEGVRFQGARQRGPFSSGDS